LKIIQKHKEKKEKLTITGSTQQYRAQMGNRELIMSCFSQADLRVQTLGLIWPPFEL
jgi:hypothetical protein